MLTIIIADMAAKIHYYYYDTMTTEPRRPWPTVFAVDITAVICAYLCYIRAVLDSACVNRHQCYGYVALIA